MAKEKEFSNDAQEALKILNFIKENGGAEIASKFSSAESFIKENGTVSKQFLETLKEQKQELKSRL